MRRFLLLTLLGMVFSTMGLMQQAVAQPGPDISVSAFYDRMAPYGNWVENREYGRVWIPRVEPGFVPYSTNGRWIMTEYGNTWMSDYEWGWGPFHYGRWIYDDYYGWAWVPDSQWGPAWVSWRSGGGYYGWAPLGPGMSINININIPLLRWIFVPQRHLMQVGISRYCIAPRRNVNIYNQTTIINNIYVNNNRRYFSGPGARDIERYSGRTVRTERVNFNPSGRNRFDDNRYGYNNGPRGNGNNYGRPNYDYRTRPDERPNRPNTPNNRPSTLPGTRPNYGPDNRPERPDNAIQRPIDRNRPEGRPSNSRPERPSGERPTTYPVDRNRENNSAPSNNNDNNRSRWNNRDNNRPQGNYNGPERPSRPTPSNNNGTLQYVSNPSRTESNGGWRKDNRETVRNTNYTIASPSRGYMNNGNRGGSFGSPRTERQDSGDRGGRGHRGR